MLFKNDMKDNYSMITNLYIIFNLLKLTQEQKEVLYNLFDIIMV